MNENLTIESLKEYIRNSSEIPGSFKLDALVLIDMASRGIPVLKHTEVIKVLSSLYQEVVSQEYKDALLVVIDKYKSEIRKLSVDYPEEPVTLGRFLEWVGVPTSEVPEEKLKMKLVVGQDDGMGYTPLGYTDVIDAYPDIDNGEIKLWV